MLARGMDPMVLAPVAVHDVDVSTPASRSVLALGTMSYIILLTMLTGGLYLAIDATAGERERGSLEPLLTVPVKREHLIYGKILATCAYMSLSLVLSVTALAVLLRFVGLESFGMSVNFGPLTALKVILFTIPLVPLGASLMTIVAAYTRSYREAQTYLGLMLLVPTLPLVFAGALGLQPTLGLMATPSLSQHFLITSLLKDEAISVHSHRVVGGGHAGTGIDARGNCRADVSPGSAAGMRASERCPKAVQIVLRELARLDFEAVVPVPATHPLDQITQGGEPPGLPLLHDVAILMKHQRRIGKELRAVADQVDASPAGGRRVSGNEAARTANAR